MRRIARPGRKAAARRARLAAVRAMPPEGGMGPSEAGEMYTIWLKGLSRFGGPRGQGPVTSANAWSPAGSPAPVRRWLSHMRTGSWTLRMLACMRVLHLCSVALRKSPGMGCREDGMAERLRERLRQRVARTPSVTGPGATRRARDNVASAIREARAALRRAGVYRDLIGRGRSGTGSTTCGE